MGHIFSIFLRFLMAYKPDLINCVLKIFINAVQVHCRKKSKSFGVKNSKCGAITVIQRAGGSLNSNVHFHTLFLDGVYTKTESGRLRLLPLSAPSQEELENIVFKIQKKVIRLLEKQGCFLDEPGEEALTKHRFFSPQHFRIGQGKSFAVKG
ncbi:hypothetical protein COB52_05015 [Candidatus Kaiserbacteria bacterium]|nr:MAG: hypothetical protein COB52_05015 [Candidatus Kaiserbacteria bacterium]